MLRVLLPMLLLLAGCIQADPDAPADVPAALAGSSPEPVQQHWSTSANLSVIGSTYVAGQYLHPGVPVFVHDFEDYNCFSVNVDGIPVLGIRATAEWASPVGEDEFLAFHWVTDSAGPRGYGSTLGPSPLEHVTADVEPGGRIVVGVSPGQDLPAWYGTNDRVEFRVDILYTGDKAPSIRDFGYCSYNPEGPPVHVTHEAPK